jgi:hypothetical protein
VVGQNTDSVLPAIWNQFRSCEALPEIWQCIGRGLMITPKNVCVPWVLPLCTEDISILWGLPLLWQTLLEHILTVCKAQSDSQALWIVLWTGCYPTFLSIGKKSFGLQAQHFYLVKNPSICEHKFLPDHPSWNFKDPRNSGYWEPLVCSMYIQNNFLGLCAPTTTSINKQF